MQSIGRRLMTSTILRKNVTLCSYNYCNHYKNPFINVLWNMNMNMNLMGQTGERMQISFFGTGSQQVLHQSDQNQNGSVSGKNEGETKIMDRLKQLLPLANKIEVEDISGGCGSMYFVFVESKEFIGMSTVKQHMMITNALKDFIKDMHGVRINTSIPKENHRRRSQRIIPKPHLKIVKLV